MTPTTLATIIDRGPSTKTEALIAAMQAVQEVAWLSGIAKELIRIQGLSIVVDAVSDPRDLSYLCGAARVALMVEDELDTNSI